MKYLEFGLLCIKTVVGSFMIAVTIWSIPYVLLDVHQTQERDRVMSEAWHKIDNEDAHLSYAQGCRDSWVGNGTRPYRCLPYCWQRGRQTARPIGVLGDFYQALNNVQAKSAEPKKEGTK